MFNWLSKFQKEETKAYCVGCRKKQPVLKIQYIDLDGNRKRLKGRCKVCKSRVSGFI